MACTILNVLEPIVHPTVKINRYGFAEVEFANRMFEAPCEESDIIGNREAIGVDFTLTNAPAFAGAKIQFTVNYLRPGDVTKTSWTVVYELSNGTYTKYAYHTDLKYIKGGYSGLTIQTVILK